MKTIVEGVAMRGRSGDARNEKRKKLVWMRKIWT